MKLIQLLKELEINRPITSKDQIILMLNRALKIIENIPNRYLILNIDIQTLEEKIEDVIKELTKINEFEYED